jgi:uncharacterized protein
MAGQIVHLEIPADDTARARGFWGSLFGWQFEQFPGPADYHMARIDERSGAAVTGPEPGLAGLRVYFDVDDIRAEAARVRELGGEAAEPMPVPSQGWFAPCSDDQGNAFGLWQSDPEAPTPALEGG